MLGSLGKSTCEETQSMSQTTEWMAGEFDSQAWYHWEYTNELDMNMKNDQLLKDGNVHEE